MKQSEEVIIKKTNEELIMLSQEGARTISDELKAENEKLNIIASIDNIK